MKKDFEIEKTQESIPLIRKNIENTKIVYCFGLSAADPENLDRLRESKKYLEHVLNPMIEKGEVGDGVKSKWDDRKFRFHSANLKDSKLELNLGITHYQECANCRCWDEEKRIKMIKEGEKIFSDPNAFFTRGCGIGVTPITSEGSIFVGKRQTEDSSYSGELGAINGWVDYVERVDEIDFTLDVLREMKEEYGILEKDIDKLIFSAIISPPSRADTDFSYLALLRINDEKFLERFQTRQDREHGELVQIANYSDMQILLQTGRLPKIEEKFNLLYCLRASLEQIKPNEMVLN